MAVALASIDPADGALKVWRDYPVTAEITDATDIDPDLVEIEVNGVSCTVANGGLEYWNTRAIDAGVVDDDLTDVYFGTVLPWWALGGETVTVVVTYDSVELDSVEFATDAAEGTPFGPELFFQAMAVDSSDSAAGPDVTFAVLETYVPAGRDIQFLVDELTQHVAADARFWVATPYVDYHSGSAVLGQVALGYVTGSGYIEGWKRDYASGGAVLQGWRRDYHSASGVVAVQYVYYGTGSGVVGLETLQYISGSAVLYGVNDDNVLELRVIDATTYAKLVAAGVVFS